MRRYLHREGRRIVLGTTLIAALLAALSLYFLPRWIGLILVVVILLAVLFVCRFFRVPVRRGGCCGGEDMVEDGGRTTVLAPADGTIVAIEEVFENEVLNERRIQVSIFMSIWNVHINWYPVRGVVEYFKYHPGRFLVAWHPKSSTDNERTTTVVRTGEGGDGGGARILFRQIAGFVARRIVSYAAVGEAVEGGQECGFIKFGSRVDVFLPVGSEVCVGLGDRTVGSQTVIARLPEQRLTGARDGDEK